MEEVAEFEKFVNAFSEAGKCLSEVKVFTTEKEKGEKDDTPNEKREKEIPIKVIDGSKVIKEFFATFLDDETKDLVNKLSNTTTSEKFDLFREYSQKSKDKADKKKKEKDEVVQELNEQKDVNSNVNDLVQKERDLNAKLSSLSPAERKEYYAKLYQIPTDRDLHTKLDTILERLEDLSEEVAIIRRHLYTK
jgi:arginyl-tRNA--protein-N-Asp/Glu arginylyltransferase